MRLPAVCAGARRNSKILCILHPKVPSRKKSTFIFSVNTWWIVTKIGMQIAMAHENKWWKGQLRRSVQTLIFFLFSLLSNCRRPIWTPPSARGGHIFFLMWSRMKLIKCRIQKCIVLGMFWMVKGRNKAQKPGNEAKKIRHRCFWNKTICHKMPSILRSTHLGASKFDLAINKTMLELSPPSSFRHFLIFLP